MTTDPRSPASRPRRAPARAARASLLLVAAGAVLLASGVARTSEVNFAGSVQLDYLLVPTDDRARDFTFDGFTTEVSIKLSADISDAISAQVKVCYGCHGFEMAAAFVDFRPFEPLRIRAGRFTPTFGDFQQRYDPANHLTSDKPLPYDMGRMLHLRDWNMSVIPAPYVDSGIEASLRAHVGDSVDLDLVAYVLGGFRAGRGAVDVDFIQSRSSELYYVDNNSRPTVGGRAAVTFLLDDASLTVGASGMYGTYDPDNELSVLLLGADVVLRIARWTLRMEYLLRRTQMALGPDPASTFRYGPGEDGVYDDFFLKDGFYAETTFPIGDLFELVARFDGMRRLGNVPITSTLRSNSAVLRYTLGTNITFAPNWRVKLSAELYDFSDFDDELGLHLGVVGAF